MPEIHLIWSHCAHCKNPLKGHIIIIRVTVTGVINQRYVIPGEHYGLHPKCYDALSASS